MKYTYICLIVSAALAITCDSGNEAGQYVEELSFEVDESLLGPSSIDSTLGFSFRPPVGWDRVPDTTLEKARDRIVEMVGEGGGFEVAPFAFFVSLQNGCACCLSHISGVDLDGETDDPLREYESLLKQKFAHATVEEGTFRVGGVNVLQYLITNDEQIVFKLLCSGPQKRTFQVDYVVPRSVYRLQIRAIESSIGSFKMLP